MGNPEMIREWRTLDDSDLVVGLDPADGHLRWFATVPRDDGTLSALATAIVLTDERVRRRWARFRSTGWVRRAALMARWTVPWRLQVPETTCAPPWPSPPT